VVFATGTCAMLHKTTGSAISVYCIALWLAGRIKGNINALYGTAAEMY